MKTLQHGRPYRPADRYRQQLLWEDIARFCIENNGKPDLWISACFDNPRITKVPGAPFPHMLKTNNMVSCYKKYLEYHGISSSPEEAIEKLAKLLVMRKHAVDLYMDNHNCDLVTALEVSHLEIEPVMKIILSGGQKDMLDKYREAALDDAALDPDMFDLLMKSEAFKKWFGN